MILKYQNNAFEIANSNYKKYKNRTLNLFDDVIINNRNVQYYIPKNFCFNVGGNFSNKEVGFTSTATNSSSFSQFK